MKDKFGIKIEIGDILALTDMHKDYSPVLCVLVGATTNFLKVKCLYIFNLHLKTKVTKFKSKNLVKVNQEQIESLTEMMFQTRLKYIQTESFETSQTAVNELLEISEELKNKR